MSGTVGTLVILERMIKEQKFEGKDISLCYCGEKPSPVYQVNNLKRCLRCGKDKIISKSSLRSRF